MTFTFPDGLAPEVYPLAWLVGAWEGVGEIVYPNIPRCDVRQSVVFEHDGGPYLAYRSSITVIGDDGEVGQVWAAESGFWRVAPEAPPEIELRENQRPLEVMVTDAAGFIALFVGAVGDARIDLATDLMARTPSAPEVAGATRMYGLVGGDLLWAWDLAAFGEPLQSYASGRLSRVSAPITSADG